MQISTEGFLTPLKCLSNRASQDPLSAPEDRSSIEPLLRLHTLQIRHKDKWRSNQCQGVSASWDGDCWLGPCEGSRLKCRPSQAWTGIRTEISTPGPEASCYPLQPLLLPSAFHLQSPGTRSGTAHTVPLLTPNYHS